jgi:hypothetical protein
MFEGMEQAVVTKRTEIAGLQSAEMFFVCSEGHLQMIERV